MNSVVNRNYNDNNVSGDDNIDAVVDCNKHNDKNEKCERDLIIGNVSEKNNAVTSSALLQTTTSRSRFVEKKDGDDEEDGTLYLTGTKSNDKRNDDDAGASGLSLFKTLSH